MALLALLLNSEHQLLAPARGWKLAEKTLNWAQRSWSYGQILYSHYTVLQPVRFVIELSWRLGRQGAGINPSPRTTLNTSWSFALPLSPPLFLSHELDFKNGSTRILSFWGQSGCQIRSKPEGTAPLHYTSQAQWPAFHFLLIQAIPFKHTTWSPGTAHHSSRGCLIPQSCPRGGWLPIQRRLQKSLPASATVSVRLEAWSP